MPILAIAFFAGPLAGIFYTYALTQISFANFSHFQPSDFIIY
jgi:hypothetical protein